MLDRVGFSASQVVGLRFAGDQRTLYVRAAL
jgi:hypothetical protein